MSVMCYFLNDSMSSHQAPCPPANPMLLRDCDTDVIIFSWNQTNEVNHYLARAVDSKVLYFRFTIAYFCQIIIAQPFFRQ